MSGKFIFWWLLKCFHSKSSLGEASLYLNTPQLQNMMVLMEIQVSLTTYVKLEVGWGWVQAPCFLPLGDAKNRESYSISKGNRPLT
jgi:hypothetical protein